MTDSTGEGLRRLGCPFCDYSTQVAARLGVHLERDHPGEVVVPPMDRSARGPGAGPDAELRDPSAWECLECGFVHVPDDRRARAAGPPAAGTASAPASARAGRPLACPRCDEDQGSRPTGVDLFVRVRDD